MSEAQETANLQKVGENSQPLNATGPTAPHADPAVISYAVRKEVGGERIGKIANACGWSLEEFCALRETGEYKAEYEKESQRRFRHVDETADISKSTVLKEFIKGAPVAARYLTRVVEDPTCKPRDRIRAAERLVESISSSKDAVRMLKENQPTGDGPTFNVQIGVQTIVEIVEQAQKLNAYLETRPVKSYTIDKTVKPE